MQDIHRFKRCCLPSPSPVHAIRKPVRMNMEHVFPKIYPLQFRFPIALSVATRHESSQVALSRLHSVPSKIHGAARCPHQIRNYSLALKYPPLFSHLFRPPGKTLAHTAFPHETTGKEYPLNPLGDAGPVINAGGLFPYAIQTGMINKLDD